MECHAEIPGRCSDADRWEFSQLAGWLDGNGLPPWGEDSREAELRWLASATEEELRMLAEQAALNLDCGAWEGVRSENGGWVEDDPDRREWHEVAADFMAPSSGQLTEGMVALATYDLVCELAALRGWCPQNGGAQDAGDSSSGSSTST